MQHLYDSKREHDISSSASAKDFLERFQHETSISVVDHVAKLVNQEDVLDIVLVGSLPLGSGTRTSDIDLLVLVNDPAVVKACATTSEQKVLRSADARLVIVQLLAMLNGIECDVQVVHYPEIGRLYRHIDAGSADLSQLEVMILSRLRTGWRLGEHAEGVTAASNLALFNSNSLEIFTTTRNYTFALMFLEDGVAAQRNHRQLALHLGRLAVEQTCVAFFSSQGFAYLGHKWFRFADAWQARLPTEELDTRNALDEARRLLFPSPDQDPRTYVDDVRELIKTFRVLICRDIGYHIAFKACTQIYDL